MGTWGFGIMENDTAADVYADYTESFNAGKTSASILDEIARTYAADLKDEDDAPFVWLAVAKAQWECGHLTLEVLDRVQSIIRDGRGLEAWREAGAKGIGQRQIALEAFLKKIRCPNERPRKPRKATIRKPIFQVGDCLAAKLSDGDYGAVIVLACPDPEIRPGRDTYGINVVGLLRYKAAMKPGPEVFEKREWLRITHHSWENNLQVTNVMAVGFRKFKDLFEVVGRTDIRPDDPQRADSYSSWKFTEQMVYQARWERV